MPSYSKQQQVGKEAKDPSEGSKPTKAKVRPADLLRGILHYYRKQMGDCYMAVEIGLDQDRRVDALLMRYFKDPIAFEVKLTRADWVTELKDPTKHVPARDLAGQLYFVAPAGIIDEEELPPGTGLFVVKPFTHQVKKIKAADKKSPTPIDWATAARIAAGALRAAEQGIT